jgi:phosphohistidine phosphatase
MIIHLVRHAEAVDRSPDIPEEHRFLTRRGRKRFRKVAGSIKKSPISPDLILTSPLVRAVQTAEILAEYLRFKGELQIAAQLAGGFQPQSLDQLLDSFPQVKEIALVGHEPDLGLLAQALLATDVACTLKKGGVVSFERAAGDQGKAEFIRLVTGKGKIVTSRGKALQRLQAENIKRTTEKGSA